MHLHRFCNLKIPWQNFLQLTFLFPARSTAQTRRSNPKSLRKCNLRSKTAYLRPFIASPALTSLKPLENIRGVHVASMDQQTDLQPTERVGQDPEEKSDRVFVSAVLTLVLSILGRSGPRINLQMRVCMALTSAWLLTLHCVAFTLRALTSPNQYHETMSPKSCVG